MGVSRILSECSEAHEGCRINLQRYGTLVKEESGSTNKVVVVEEEEEEEEIEGKRARRDGESRARRASAQDRRRLQCRLRQVLGTMQDILY